MNILISKNNKNRDLKKYCKKNPWLNVEISVKLLIAILKNLSIDSQSNTSKLWNRKTTWTQFMM